MQITVLTHVETEGGTDWDVAADDVAAALGRGGHTATILGVRGDLRRLLDGLDRTQPDLVFNVLEEFGTTPTGNIAVCGVLEALGLPYTGSGLAESFLGQDKALTKRLLAFDGLLFPRFAVFHKDKDFETAGNLHMPLFVKPCAMDASIGIGAKSLVHNSTELMERVLAIHREHDDSALVEEFIDGREFYVGIVGNSDPTALPPIELDFSRLPPGAPKVYGSEAKWGVGTPEFEGIKPVVADIPDELRAKLHKVSLDAYRAVRVRDYGRVDLRVAPTGDIYVIEVNASCYLKHDDEFAMAAAAGGIGYDALVEQIVCAAAKRHAARTTLRAA